MTTTKSDSRSTKNPQGGKDGAVVENAKATSHRELPPLPPDYSEEKDGVSVLLFYQYVEPLWTSSQHRRALRKLMELCQQNKITGRGRVAPEGMNCTLTGNSRGMRQVCQGLREFDKLFWETDFKITDRVPKSKQFKSLSVRKTEELVAYGLKGDAVAPSLTHFQGTHLEANEYHEALQDPDAVVVDVRNFYETALGAFNPPPGGAKLVDPKLRNSIEFSRWLVDPDTQKELNGKKVLMYCTGGIRCERATALLNQMVTASEDNNNEKNENENQKTDHAKNNDEPKSSEDADPSFACKPKGVYELRGGIERYVKTFPQGGFWRGKNYLFDRRMEQIPEGRSMEDVEREIDSVCCVCHRKWTVYRGQYSCASKLCGVPVIVCTHCTTHATENPQSLQCDLCRENYRPRAAQPDLAKIKRKAEEKVLAGSGGEKDTTNNMRPAKKGKHDSRERYSDRLFLSRLPLTATVTKIQQALIPVETETVISTKKQKQHNSIRVHWLRDQETHSFYGSCMVHMPSAALASDVIARASETGIRLAGHKKRVKVSYVWKRKEDDMKDDDPFASTTFQAREFPPIQ
ncbi:UPF0176 protein [Seminavis robusta]|uniref:UPF0176 protein n=1 Tax=Seminavis robusta TaxID=568900 RepID=A0A9N8DJA3_9STRA|nr:UPF0176 protein [Seminavis robusta]|eukprot:Sro152_g069490.1 UPF0176 protein (575) ;mRNA; r:58068-59892